MSDNLCKTRVRKYRAQLKESENEQKLMEYRQKAKESSKKYYKKILENDDKIKRRREANAAAAKRYRDKLIKSTIPDVPSQPQQQNTAFGSASSKSHALNRVEQALPRDEFKKKILIKELMRRHNIQDDLPPKIPQKKCRKAFVGIPDLVNFFYESDAVSRLMPGTRDVIKIKNADGTTVEIQKQIMIMSVRNAWLEFTKTFPEKKCSLSYFQGMRPRHVMKKCDSKYFSCMCIYCENFQLLCASFSPYIEGNKIYSPSDYFDILCCSRLNFECANNNCDECKNYIDNFKLLLKACCSDEAIRLEKWVKNPVNQFTEKSVVPNVKVSDAIQEFEESFKYIKLHKFIEATQKNYLNECRENLEENEVILIVDYAEKFSAQFQRSVQQQFFGARSMSIFTCRAYVGKHAEYSFAIVSDNVKQSKFEVFASLNYIIMQLKQCHPDITHIKIFSDGCGGQFKNKFQFKNLIYAQEDFGTTIELAFFPTGHGKSACDGIGAASKRHARYCVLAEGLSIVTASDFVECSKKFADKIHVYELTQEEINSHEAKLKARWEKNVKAIQGTMKFHSIKVDLSSKVLTASITSLGHGSNDFNLT